MFLSRAAHLLGENKGCGCEWMLVEEKNEQLSWMSVCGRWREMNEYYER